MQVLTGAVLLVCLAGAAVSAAGAWRIHVARSDGYFADWRSSPVFAAAARGEGPLLVGGDLFLIQLRTRRPVLIDPATLDTMPYAIEAAPRLDHILRDVYGVSLFNPPDEARGRGTVPPRANRAVWERYEPARWVEIRRDYGVTQVVTPTGWRLQLPFVAESKELKLYAIPQS
jgi:hypothetical protein